MSNFYFFVMFISGQKAHPGRRLEMICPLIKQHYTAAHTNSCILKMSMHYITYEQEVV